MKKIGLVGLGLLILAFAYFLRQPEKNIVVNESTPLVEKSQQDSTPLMLKDDIARSEIKVPAHGKGLRFTANEKNLKKIKDELADYSRTRLSFFDRPLFLVDGVHATYRQIPGQKAIASIGGFFVYTLQTEDSFPVVYSPEKNAYGYFTGEVIVSGAFEKALDLIQSQSFEVLYKNDLTEQIIFKVGHLNDLSSIEELKSLPNIKVEADLKFSRMNQI